MRFKRVALMGVARSLEYVPGSVHVLKDSESKEVFMVRATCTIDEKTMTDVNTMLMISDDFRTTNDVAFICMAMDSHWWTFKANPNHEIAA